MSIRERAETLIVSESSLEKADDDSAEIYAVRAEIRNSLRTFSERYAPLARIFRTVHMPKITVENVCGDETAYISARAQKLCKDNTFDSFDEARLFVQTERSKDTSVDQMKSEEEARYFVLKIQQYLRCGLYDRVVQIFEETPLNFHRERSFLQFFVDSVEIPIFHHLRSLLIDRNASEFMEAYLKISGVLPCEGFDVSDICDELLEDECFQSSLREILGDTLDVHPYIYKKTKDYILALGILDGENIESKPEIRIRVRHGVYNFAKVGPEAYMVLEKLFIETGLLDQQGVIEEAVLTEAILSQLAGYMRKSPRLYSILCDRWANLRGVLRYEVNERPEIRRALDTLLIRRIENHPNLYEHFRKRAAFVGVDPYDEKLLKRTLKSKNASLQDSPAWLNDYSFEDLQNFMIRHSLECEQTLQKQVVLSENLLKMLEFSLEDYEKNFPHVMRGERPLLGKILD